MLIGEDVVHGRRLRLRRPEHARRAIVANAHEATASHVDDAVGRAEQRPRAPGRARPPPSAPPRSRRAAGILRSPPPRARRAGRPRGRQAVGRGRRRRLRGDRLPRVLRPGRARARRRQPLIQLPGERNAMRYVARGVTGVIAPWNFPLAIAAGMVAAALATGNAVVLKPAEQAPACAKAVVDALHAGGVPLDALSLLPGRRRARQGAGRRPAHPHDRLHRLLRRRPADPRARPPRSSPASATSSA